MQSLIQKSDQPQAPLLPAWHPNFRKLERLPDTKVVRTRFFINFVTLAVAASLLLYFSYREYAISSFGQQMADWQAKIDTNRKASDQVLVLSRKFADEEKKLAEFDAFLRPRMVFSEFVLHLASTLPPELTLDTVSIEDTGVNLRGFIVGKAEEASGRISPYVEQLKQDQYLGAMFGTVTQNRLERDQSSGQLTFELFLPFKGIVKK
jgi:hypothetical protein